MYLSRVELDIKHRDTMIALINPQKIHGAVENSFPGERRRRLWRLDQLSGKLYLLILSEEKPNLQGLVAQFGMNDYSSSQTKLYDTLLDRIQSGSIWRFRLTANPTHRRLDALGRDENGRFKRGKVQACSTLRFQEEWLLQQSKNHGFALHKDAFAVVDSHWLNFTKEKGRGMEISLLAVTYEGILRVTDLESFRKTLIKGIGRGKAYGLGLMTIISTGGVHG